MANEFVLLGGVAPTEDDWREALLAIAGECNLLGFVGGLKHATRLDGTAILSWWPHRDVNNPREAREELGDLPEDCSVWVDVVLPAHGDVEGLRVLHALAGKCSMTLVRRS